MAWKCHCSWQAMAALLVTLPFIEAARCRQPPRMRKLAKQDVCRQPSLATRLINGSFIAENNRFLESLHLDSGGLSEHSDGSVRRGIILSNLSSLLQFSAPTIFVMDEGGIDMRDLPTLEAIEMPGLMIPGYIHLDNLPRLIRSFSNPSGIRTLTDVAVHDVGLDSVDPYFSVGYKGLSISVDGIPNVHKLNYELTDAHTVRISGNGNLSILFSCATCSTMINRERKLVIKDLSLSGVASMSQNYSDGVSLSNITVGTITASNNTFSDIFIDFTELTSLHVVDNPNLVSLRFGSSANSYYNEGTEITISNNPRLKMNSTTPDGLIFDGQHASGSTFIWPEGNTSSMVFEGPFDNNFLPFVQRSYSKPRVLSKFIVASTLGPDQCNCTALNTLRKNGALKGEYSCQGQTVPDESQPSSSRTPQPAVNAGLAFMMSLLVSTVAVARGYLKRDMSGPCGFQFWNKKERIAKRRLGSDGGIPHLRRLEVDDAQTPPNPKK
ncbi:hypothetical protein B0T22DRAFT_532662 [Podospora appendiculata]|uniref:Glycoside Hydrolase Family 28 n=1 Tax=Podospora appendiculata TaxID=314037 RepID=A0AAE0XH69_9PEZI|nr:hypothetical protein B0T22DRAFT_532662 [Podospora appendiculata]